MEEGEKPQVFVFGHEREISKKNLSFFFVYSKIIAIFVLRKQYQP